VANTLDMLRLNGGSFERAEAMGRAFIEQGRKDVWLDLSILYFSWGRLDEWRHAQDEYAKYFPDCPRLIYNRGWRVMRDDGNFDGLRQFVEAGRATGAFGNWQMPEMKCPRWDGRANLEGKTIILWGEGGQGDQVIGLRAGRWLADRGAKVVAAVSAPLLNLANRCPGVSASIDRESAHLAGHDYYLQGMSAPYVCGRSWETLWPGPYVINGETDTDLWNRVVPRVPGRLNVGLRWRGNPAYEEDVLRWFPPELMLGLADIPRIDFYSLQKEDPQCLPAGVTDLEPLLSSWACTVSAIARMDVVITACTSVAHVAAAMGVPTWVMVPLTAYYPWARPGDRSQWYPSVRLFRQVRFDEWWQPFAAVRQSLRSMATPGMTVQSFDEFLQAHDQPPIGENVRYVEGREIAVLTGLIRKHGVRRVLEIGINRGDTAQQLLRACPTIEQYTGVEITPEAIGTMPEHQRNEREWAGDQVGAAVAKDKRVKLLVTPNGSRDVQPNGGCDLIFIDGNHDHEWVKHDTELAKRLDAAIVVWHDYGTEPGVTQVVDGLGETVTRVLGTRMAYQLASR